MHCRTGQTHIFVLQPRDTTSWEAFCSIWTWLIDCCWLLHCVVVFINCRDFLSLIKLVNLFWSHLCYTWASIFPYRDMMQWQKQFCRCVNARVFCSWKWKCWLTDNSILGANTTDVVISYDILPCPYDIERRNDKTVKSQTDRIWLCWHLALALCSLSRCHTMGM